MINISVSLNWDIVRAMATTSPIMDNKFMVNGKKIQASLTNTFKSANILRSLEKEKLSKDIKENAIRMYIMALEYWKSFKSKIKQ